MGEHTIAITVLAGLFLGIIGALRYSSGWRVSEWQKLFPTSSYEGAHILAPTADLAEICGHVAARAYNWLAANPYPAVIGGMILYMTVLLTVSSLLDKGRNGQHEELKRKYQEYQRFQHYVRLRRWQQQQRPEHQERQQQQQRQQQPVSKWGGMMGFGAQPVPEGCQGAVKEVLSAMDFYEVLAVPWDKINTRVLKAARKARALSVHPDKVGLKTPGCDIAGSRVNMAFETLSNAQSRQEYDDWLSQQF